MIRHDQIAFERYADGCTRTTKHGTASLAKALVGGVSLMLAMDEGCIRPDDRAAQYAPGWDVHPQKRSIAIQHLATHTSGLEDAEADGLPHDQLPGWKGEFWRRLDPPRDPFTLARDVAPVRDEPGRRARYSNPGMAMLSYCVTASLRGAPDADVRSLLAHRILMPLGVPDGEWSCGYESETMINGLTLIANWGGGSFSPNAAARIGRLMLRRGEWDGTSLISRSTVATATTFAGMPNHSGLGWWVNRTAAGARVWNALPNDAFWGSGAGHQLLLVVPGLDLIVVRNGGTLDETLDFNAGLETHLVNPLMQAFITGHASRHGEIQIAHSGAEAPAKPPYPPSPVIQRIDWAPPSTILRQADDSDCWPLTWGDDDCLYTAYGDGYGFDPKVPEKLSMGFAAVSGSPPEIAGINIRSTTGETTGSGPNGKKASGIVMVNGVLYLWARNAGNSQLARSDDRGQTWIWIDWKFTESFGCPTFLNFGRNYAGARDGYVYVSSPDSDSAYAPADRMVLARVPTDAIVDRESYEFMECLDAGGAPVWTPHLDRRGAVFRHGEGSRRCLRSQITYNAAISRYLWWQQLPGSELKDRADTRYSGGFGVYDAPEPWGPWTTAYFTERWDVGPGETGGFPTKWMSADGRSLYLIFSGDDCFSVRKATLTLRPRHD